jgi:hypothetical protein
MQQTDDAGVPNYGWIQVGIAACQVFAAIAFVGIGVNIAMWAVGSSSHDPIATDSFIRAAACAVACPMFILLGSLSAAVRDIARNSFRR